MGLGVAGLEAIATGASAGRGGRRLRRAARDRGAGALAGRDLRRDRRRCARQGGYARALSADEKAKVAPRSRKHMAAADLIITTAAIPGKPSPKLISKAQVAGMKAGAVIVDLSPKAAATARTRSRARRRRSAA
jgi:NAD(P) transhydrogenase subunit alpha